MSNNPLQQYFRRPAIYIQLPSKGRFYSSADVDIPPDGEIPVYPMSAIDEITSRTPDALFNGHAVVDIIKSCVPAIKNPWKINTIDLDVILIAIKIASSGENMDIMSTCPACEVESKFGINMTGLLASRRDVDYSKTLKIRDLNIKFRPLTYEETNKTNLAQYEIQKLLKNLNEIEDPETKAKASKQTMEYLNNITAEIISNTIESIQTPETTVTDKQFIREFLENSDRQTSASIRDYSMALREESDLKPMDIKCISCGHQYKQQLMLNVSDFFA